MTSWMAREFVKDYRNTEDVKMRTSYGLFSSVAGICCNVLLFTVKLLMGLLINSISAMVNVFNNLSDAVSSIIGSVGVKMAGRPADEDHPFGHGQVEYIAAFIVAFIVIQVGSSLFKISFGKIWNPEVMTSNMASAVILLLSIGVRLWINVSDRASGKWIQSKVILVTVAGSMGDVATTSAMTPFIAVFGIWGVDIDGFTGLVASVVAIITDMDIAKGTLAPLIGEAIDPKTYKGITDFVEQYDGIVGSHDLVVHNYGSSRSMASIHAEVPSEVDVEANYEIIDAIEQECARRLDIFLVIHMDPAEVTNTRVSGFRDMVMDVLAALDSKLQFHDFRIVNGTERVNPVFDLVVPRDYNSRSWDTIKLKISEYIHERDSRCYCVTTVENSFYAKILEDTQK